MAGENQRWQNRPVVEQHRRVGISETIYAMSRILIFLCCLLARNAVAVDVIAHRGYVCDAIENTTEAIQAAWLAGADGVEVDLRVSKDGVIFLYHDDNIRDQPVSNLTYSAIQSGDKNIAPSFESILRQGAPPGYYILDLKENDAGNYRSLAALIAAAEIDPRYFAVQSASTEVLLGVKEYLPNARFFYLADLDRSFPFFRVPKVQNLLKKIEGLGIESVSLKGRSFLDRKFIQSVKEAGYRINVWTINDPKRATFYRDIGVDGIITDFVTQTRLAVVNGKLFNEPCTTTRTSEPRKAP